MTIKLLRYAMPLAAALLITAACDKVSPTAPTPVPALPSSFDVTGQLNVAGGAVADGVSITATCLDRSEGDRFAVSDPDGRFELDGLRRGQWQLTFKRKGLGDYTAVVDVNGNLAVSYTLMVALQ